MNLYYVVNANTHLILLRHSFTWKNVLSVKDIGARSVQKRIMSNI